MRPEERRDLLQFLICLQVIAFLEPPFGRDSVPGGYVADTSNGEWVEYGHYFSVMSAQFGGEWDDATKPIYNPAEKVRLGWLAGNEVQYVTLSGTYRLFRHDARDTVGAPRGIRIETPATDYTGYGHRYWLQYRYAPWSSAQNWMRNGIEVDVAQTSYGSDGSIELDMSPYSKDQSSPFYNASSPPGSWWTIDNSDKLDGALVVGRTYDDTPAGIHITPIATGSNGTNEEYIDLVINLDSFPGNHPPTITSFSASTNAVAAGQPVAFTLAASDPDGDTLAYAWDFDEGQVWTASGLNSPAATKSWSTPGQYRVVATVSDMKGGITTVSQIITVGAPANTNQVWGRVLWGGLPVYGARVWTTNGAALLQAWTESDGSYTLTDLPPVGSYRINCQRTGLTFAPQFANPIALAGGNIYGADFYANEPLGTANGNTYTISGQVTDPVNGVAGVEVRGAGIASTTDASGNYQLTNLLNGSYVEAAANGSWTFTPASRSVTISSASSTGNNFSRIAPYSISGTLSGIPAASQSPAPTIYLSNGRSVTATKAGSGGSRYWAYTLNNVPAGQYSLSAQLSGYSIVPSGFANPLTVSGNVSGANFTGTASIGIAGSISGRVTLYGTPLAGVTVASQAGTSVGSAQTDSDGNYRIPNLPSGPLTLTPSKPGYSFSPTTMSLSYVPSSGNNFNASSSSASPPVISSVTATPASLPGPGSTTTLSALASGSGPLRYQWDATLAPGPVALSINDSAAASSTVAGFQVPGAYTFRARVTDTNGFAATRTLNVVVSAGLGSLAVSPYEVQVPAGQTLAFSADAWDQLGNPISVSPTWSVSGGGIIDSAGVFNATALGGPYQVVATASGLSATGSVWVTSGGAPAVPPSITQQPAGLAVAAGSNVSFSVLPTGTSPLSYQWRLNTSSIAGATQSTLTRANAQSADAGPYTVLITNVAGSVTSAPAVLTVNNAPVLAAIADRLIHAGTTLIVSNSASDPDPMQTLTFSLGATTPTGATIDPATGLFTWATPPNAVNTTNCATIRVTDNGSPALSDAKSFTIALLAPPAVQSIVLTNRIVNITWSAIAGRSYQLQSAAPITNATWTAVGPAVLATTNVATVADSATNTSRFYRILALP